MQDVAVSVVGKYCYHMHSPAEHQTLPLIVDIILVGRTKIITLHSSIWLTNNTDRHVAFRLHVPITPLVAPARVGPPNRKQRSTDHVIGPLDPQAGTLLLCRWCCSLSAVEVACIANLLHRLHTMSPFNRQEAVISTQPCKISQSMRCLTGILASIAHANKCAAHAIT